MEVLTPFLSRLMAVDEEQRQDFLRLVSELQEDERVRLMSFLIAFSRGV